MDDRFNIYIDRLKNGRVEKFEESFDPVFMDIHEKELAFREPIYVTGEACLEGDALVLRFSVETKAVLPCSVCNEDVQFPLSIPAFCHAVEPENLKSGVFSYRDVLREIILLEVPLSAECQGDCPGRVEMARYFSNQRN